MSAPHALHSQTSDRQVCSCVFAVISVPRNAGEYQARRRGEGGLKGALFAHISKGASQHAIRQARQARPARSRPQGGSAAEQMPRASIPEARQRHTEG